MRRTMRKFMVAVSGAALILLGIFLAIPGIPGPGVLLIAAGLALLGTEFHWAQRMHLYLKQVGKKILPAFLAERINFSDEEKKIMEGIRE